MRKICLKLDCPFLELCPENNNYEIIDNCCTQAEKIKELSGLKTMENEILSLKTQISKKEIEIESLTKKLETLSVSPEKPSSELEEMIETLKSDLKAYQNSKKNLIKQNNKLTEEFRKIELDKLGLKKEGMKKLWQKARDNSEEINGEQYISISHLKSLI